jgi:hypothetical protein
VVLALVAGTAHAETSVSGPQASGGPSQPEPAPAAERAREANLESTSPRKGTTFAAALVPDLVIGAGTGDVGTGGLLDLRLGQNATPDLIISIELAGGTVLLHEHAGTIYQNKAADLMIGVQDYVLPSLWVRLAGGFGNYTRDGVFDRVGVKQPDELLNGVVGCFGIGIDVVRVRRWVIDFEIVSTTLLEKHGFTSVSGMGVGIARY